jgi:pimeloyl-ACP methyl ester carboxylesterase
MKIALLQHKAMAITMLFAGVASATAQSAPSVAALSPRPGAAAPAIKPTIVLVHGAFADGTGWQYVIPLLEKDGYFVIAVQNTLTSLADDIATTRRVLEAQKGPVIAVGHSYGGIVITGAASGNPNVKALVYIAAFAPDANEPVGPLTEKYPSSLGKALRPDAAGYLYVDRAMFRDVFAADVSDNDLRVMAAAQKPVNSTVFGATLPSPAWKSIPSWYLVARQDRAINPDLERFFAKRIGATTSEVNSSHVPFVSQPKVVVRLIEDAATATAK